MSSHELGGEFTRIVKVPILYMRGISKNYFINSLYMMKGKYVTILQKMKEEIHPKNIKFL